MRKIILTVLCVHVILLLLWWGGLSTLGMATALMIPIFGTTTWLAYQMGQNKLQKKGVKEDSFDRVDPFRVHFRNFRG